MKRAIANEKTLEFLLKGGRNLITVVQQNAKDYHELRQQAMRDAATEKPVRKAPEKPKDTTPVQGYDLLDSMFEEN